MLGHFLPNNSTGRFFTKNHLSQKILMHWFFTELKNLIWVHFAPLLLEKLEKKLFHKNHFVQF